MYVDVSHIRHGDKTYTRYLLRESFRDNGKVKHRTIANLSSCSTSEIEAIRLALRHKDNLSALTTTPPQFTIKQGPSYGAVHVVYEVARSLGIDQALGITRDGQLAAVTLRIGGWATLDLEQRTITIGKDADALAQATKLDGCYVLKTDLSQTAASKEIIHDRYKDLALVEWAFRQSKTVHLEMRPIHVRLESRTRGHSFVVMLAYSIIQALAKHWRHLDPTVHEGLSEIHLPDKSISHQLPTPRDTIQKLLDAAQTRLPAKIVSQSGNVTTKTKLTTRRTV